MIRYVAAGLAMMVGVVLLFMASFGTQRGKPASIAADQAPPAARSDSPIAPPAAQSPEALAALRAQINQAARTMTALQSEVEQTRQDLASLQAQKKQAEAAVQPAPAPPAAAVVPRPTEAPRLQAAQPASLPPRLRPADAHPAEPRPIVPEGAAAADVLSRLRQQVLPPVAEAAPSAGSQPVVTSPVGPHRIPAADRLADARAAVIEGRIEDARRFLQAAQVQLVFRPVEPGADAPQASRAAGPVGQALAALGYGDQGRALVAIDQAIGVLQPRRDTRQSSAVPQGNFAGDAGDPAVPAPVQRNWP